MGKRTLFTGIIVGGIVGGLTTLFNKDVRAYTGDKLSYLKDPSDAISRVRTTFSDFNENFTHTAANALNALEQAESTMNKVMKKESK